MVKSIKYSHKKYKKTHSSRKGRKGGTIGDWWDLRTHVCKPCDQQSSNPVYSSSSSNLFGTPTNVQTNMNEVPGAPEKSPYIFGDIMGSSSSETVPRQSLLQEVEKEGEGLEGRLSFYGDGEGQMKTPSSPSVSNQNQNQNQNQLLQAPQKATQPQSQPFQNVLGGKKLKFRITKNRHRHSKKNRKTKKHRGGMKRITKCVGEQCERLSRAIRSMTRREERGTPIQTPIIMRQQSNNTPIRGTQLDFDDPLLTPEKTTIFETPIPERKDWGTSQPASSTKLSYMKKNLKKK